MLKYAAHKDSHDNAFTVFSLNFDRLFEVTETNMNIPEDLNYTKDHEWVKVAGSTATVGITDFAQRELGDIVYVEIETEGEDLASEDPFGTIEAVKTVSDLFMPVSGKVSAVNQALENNPQAVNEDPYGEGWMVKIEMSDLSQVDGLITAAEYSELVASYLTKPNVGFGENART